MQPTFGEFAKVMTELAAINSELAAAPTDPKTTAAYYVLKGLLAAAREEKREEGK